MATTAGDPAPALDFAPCERVRYARDAAYDGLVFICVTSTRIYCRPVCPVRQPLSRNVRSCPSAAAAEAAGFSAVPALPAGGGAALPGVAGRARHGRARA